MLTILDRPNQELASGNVVGSVWSPTMDKTDTPKTLLYQHQRGIHAFALLFRRWVDQNRWSHARMVAAAHQATGHAWLHSSQIAGLLVGRLTNPGPRVFMALAALNRVVAQVEAGEAPACIADMSLFQGRRALRDELGNPLGMHDLIDIFCGLVELPQVDAYDPQEAARISTGLSRLVRGWFIRQGIDPYDHIDTFLTAYAAESPDEEKRLVGVLLRGGTYPPEDISAILGHYAQALNRLGEWPEPWNETSVLAEALKLA